MEAMNGTGAKELFGKARVGVERKDKKGERERESKWVSGLEGKQ